MPKIFTEKEKNTIKISMFEKGFELLKKEGMTHMSVEKITSSCNIGKSTFYNFFSSKEDFVIQLIEYKRNKALESIKNKLNGKDKMSVLEGKELLKSMTYSTDSIYQYLKLEDLLKLQKKINYLSNPDIDEETALLKEVFGCIENTKSDLDYSLIANLLKIITLVTEEKKLLHEKAYDRTIDTLYHTLFENIFIKEAL